MKTNKFVQIQDIISENSYLLIVWSNAISKLENIEQDIIQSFDIQHRFKIEWSKEHFQENMGRFYGKKLPDISEKVKHCGMGEFTLYILSDPHPDWRLIGTSSGLQMTNKNIFNAKQRYRELTGGGHKVHATNNQAETLRDASLLLGSYLPQIPDSEKALVRDLSGAESWDSLEDFFAVINFCSKYVVLRNYASLPVHHDASTHGDIDILCSDRDEFQRITNARPVFPQHYRRYHMINISGKEIPFDIRDTDEGYYCKKWSEDIIQRRILENKIYVPCKNDHIYSLTYHVLLHKKTPSQDYCTYLLKLFERLDQKDPVTFEMGYITAKLRTFISTNRYDFVRPLDWSVYCNYKNFPEIRLPISRYFFDPPRRLWHIKRETIEILKICWHHKKIVFIRKALSRLMRAR